jgi:outer membrane lipoprotein-sorting protein
MVPKRLLLIFLFMPGFTEIMAQDLYKPMKDTAAFKARISERALKTNTIESDFIQEKNLSVLSEKIITKGHFYFKKENLLRWEYADPFNYVIIINKDKVMIKDEDKVSRYDMNANKMFKSINDMMISSVQGNVLNTKDYSIRYLENPQFFIAELTPLQKGTREVLKTINLFFNRDEYFVAKVKMMEPSGDYTSIDFINHKNNESIPDTKFTIH